MTIETSNKLFEALDGLLEEERTALLKGELEEVGQLYERKEALIEELSQIEAFEAQELYDLQGKMKRNQELLDSALEGIRTVAGRLAALRRVRTKLDTYDANGTKQSIDMPTENALEKRA